MSFGRTYLATILSGQGFCVSLYLGHQERTMCLK
jgi:hypothetical protein